MTKPPSKTDAGSKAALRDMQKVIGDLKANAPKMSAPTDAGSSQPAGRGDALENARKGAQQLAQLQPLAPSVTLGASQFGPGKLQPTPKETRPVETVETPGDVSATPYDHALERLDYVMSNTKIVLILPYLRKVDQAAEAAGIPHDQVVADVKNRLAAWEAGTGVSLAGKLRDVYAHYNLPIDDATSRKLNEVAAPGGAAAKEKLAQNFEMALQNFSQTGSHPDGFSSTLGKLGRMYDSAMHLSAYAADPAEAKQRTTQAFNDTTIRLLKGHTERLENYWKSHSKLGFSDWNSVAGLEGFVKNYGHLLSPAARQEVDGVAALLKPQKPAG